MSHDYNSLLRLAYEIEGLLLLQQRRGADAEVAIDEMLADKIAQLAGDFPVRGAESYSVTEPVHAEEAPVIASDSNDACEASLKAADGAVAASAVEEEVAESNGVKEPVAPVSSLSMRSLPVSVPRIYSGLLLSMISSVSAVNCSVTHRKSLMMPSK